VCLIVELNYWKFDGIGKILMEGMEQGWLQWSYGFLEGA